MGILSYIRAFDDIDKRTYPLITDKLIIGSSAWSRPCEKQRERRINIVISCFWLLGVVQCKLRLRTIKHFDNLRKKKEEERRKEIKKKKKTRKNKIKIK